MKSLQKLSYKTLFTILFLSLAGIVFFSKIGKPAKKISAAWWNDSWHYRQLFPISNTSGSNQNDMVVKINLDTSLLISSGKTQSSCNDIRLTDTTGNILQHFITQCNTQMTNVYVKIPTIPSSGSEVYLYYGNSTATNIETSDIFTYFDGFESATPKDAWTTTQLSVNIASDFSNKGNSAIKFIAQGPSFDNLYQTFSSSNNWTNHYLEYEFYVNQTMSNWWTDPRNSSGSRMNAWKSFSMTATSWNTFSEDLNTNTYKGDIKSIMYFTSGDDINRNIYIDNFRIRHCLSTITVGTTQPEESGGGPIAYWKFNEGSGTTAYDSSGNNDGTISEATFMPENQCISGTCLHFSDSSSQYVLSKNNITLTGDQSFSVWIYPTKNDNNLRGIFTNHNHNNTSGIGINLLNSKFSVSIGYTDGTREYNLKTSNYSVPLNEWTHVVLNYNDTDKSISFYTNGKLDKTWVLDKTVKITPDKILVGQWATSYIGNYKFDGIIDEPKIYSYLLTPDQIKQEYNSRGSFSGSGVNLGVRVNPSPETKYSLVAYYKFDENNGTTVYDSSGNHNNGSLGTGSSAPLWSLDGKSNSSLTFNNNHYVSLPNDLGYSNTVSAFAWVKTNGTPIGGYHIVFGGSQLEISIPTNGQARTGINTDSRYVSNHGSGLTDGKWHHVGFTFDGSTKKTYIDGDFVGEQTGITGTLVSSFSGRTLGKLGSSDSYFLNGKLDEVKIYNKALTAEEVKQDYNAGSAVQFGSTTQNIGGTNTSLEYCIPGDTSYCAPPISEWNFEENTGVIAKDTSGNNNNGTFGAGNSAPTWNLGANNKGTGINFDGINDYISIPTFTYTTNATISVWIKGSYLNGNQIIIGSPNSIALGLYNTGSNKGIIGSASISKSVGIADNFINDSWNHLTVVFNNSGDATYYCNGQLLANNGTNNWSWGSGAYIGRRDSGNYFKGQIDQLKIYNYARTPAQIAYDYNKGAPIGHWKLDECQGNIAHDSSGNNNHGTINIGVNGAQNSLGTCAIGTSAAWTNGANGKINSSLSFDGVDDYINVANNTIFNLSNNDYSISLWFKAATSMTDNPGMILQRYTGGSPGAGYWIALSNNKLYFENRADGDSLSITTDNSYNDNLWHHVIITVDTSTKIGKMYIDGHYIKSDSYTGNILNHNTNLTIGGRSTAYRYNGQLDDIRIYNYALTPEQVKTVYNNGAVNFQ